MERRDAVTIGDVLRECLEQSQMQERLDEVRACDNFAIVVGQHLASLCRRPTMHAGVMSISTSNSSLRSDLNMRRGRIMADINDLMGKQVVKEIVFKG